VRVYPTHPIEARCRCSSERIGRILRSFPADDIEELRKDKVISVTCEFCNTRYEFAGEDFAPLASA
jgi:molecular chaperone Hsp33